MENFPKHIISIIVAGVVICIAIAIKPPRPKLTFYDKIQIQYVLEKGNKDLPLEVGTIGYLDSISFSDETLICVFRVKGNDKIMQIYADNYNEFKDMQKYLFTKMNGNRHFSENLMHFVEAKGINLCVKVYTETKKSMTWYITNKELKSFSDSCKQSPTATLQKVIDMQLKIANLELPLTPNDTKQVSSIATNSLIGDSIDENCLLQSITHKWNDIFFEYKISDFEIKDIERLEEKQDDLDFIDALVQDFSQDKDMLEFIDMLVISRSNMILVYQCHKNSFKKQVTIKIPYQILRKHCHVPQELL